MVQQAHHRYHLLLERENETKKKRKKKKGGGISIQLYLEIFDNDRRNLVTASASMVSDLQR
jgi:hypothetical protein